jgi:hypothetical protein
LVRPGVMDAFEQSVARNRDLLQRSEVDASVGAVQRELENLSRVGLIVRKSVGSQVFYQANRDSPIFREMQALVNKTIGVFSGSPT